MLFISLPLVWSKKANTASHVMKKHFNKKKELVITTEIIKNFESINKCWICNNTFNEGDVKVIDHCHITGKYRAAANKF